MKDVMEVIMPTLEVTRFTVSEEYVINHCNGSETWWGGLRKKIQFLMFTRLKKVGYLKNKEEKIKRVSMKKVEFHIKDIDKMILEYEYLIMLIYQQRVGTLIVGPNQLMGMYDTPMRVQILDRVESNIRVEGKRLQLGGMEIIVLPWFDGVLPVPMIKESIYLPEGGPRHY